MPKRLKRFYGSGQLHFITCSCYRRLPLLGTARARSLFLQLLDEVRIHYQFDLFGYVVMPEHIHLLIGEPKIGNPSTVMRVLKQRVSRALRRRRRKRLPGTQLCFWQPAPVARYRSFWQARFYDFNIGSKKKKNEKLHYMHFNPVKRGLVDHPKKWLWSSYSFYAQSGLGLVLIDAVK